MSDENKVEADAAPIRRVLSQPDGFAAGSVQVIAKWLFNRDEDCGPDALYHPNQPAHLAAAYEAEANDLLAALTAAAMMLPPIKALVEAAEALGAMPEGYCFCSKDRIGDDSKTHEPECRDLRYALAALPHARKGETK